MFLVVLTFGTVFFRNLKQLYQGKKRFSVMYSLHGKKSYNSNRFTNGHFTESTSRSQKEMGTENTLAENNVYLYKTICVLVSSIHNHEADPAVEKARKYYGNVL